MEITDQALDEFITLWRQSYGEDIDRERARHYASQLLQLLQAVYDTR